MRKHKPIKFRATLEPRYRDVIKDLIRDNEQAMSVAQATLALIAAGGVLTCGVIAPGLLGGLARMRRQSAREHHEEYARMWRSFHHLRKSRALVFEGEKDGYLVYRLTNTGKKKLKTLLFNTMKIQEPKRWDKKWRLVLFDIPESHKLARKALTTKLHALGFYQCQKSAWIHPFPCLEEIELVKDQYRIKSFVQLFVVEEMSDGKVLYHFRQQLKRVL
ncbi:hypothetical protein HY732_00325 [Candidatus Uhrbacteria bacterium]|nr:hypothetical protein [Candidatus Uhrbacteria bacterium]